VEWVRVRFDGGSLVLANLTRKRPGIRAYLVVGPANSDQVYPSAGRVVGLGPLRARAFLWALQARFNAGTEAHRAGNDLLFHFGFVRDRIASDQLQLLLLHEHRFEPPLLFFEGGRVTAYLRPMSGTDVPRLIALLPGLDIALLPELDTTPWDGLQPRIPARKAMLGLRHPPRAGS
jgi:hypothetical protein